MIIKYYEVSRFVDMLRIFFHFIRVIGIWMQKTWFLPPLQSPGTFSSPVRSSQGYRLDTMWIETFKTDLSAGRKIFFRLYEICERCRCRRLGKMTNKSKSIRPLCDVFCTDGRQDHSSSNWSLDCRLDDGELWFDSLEDQRHYFPPQCFVRGSYPTQSLLSAPWEFVPEG
jgi:hypothetical protein